jgi:hypothetical protein
MGGLAFSGEILATIIQPKCQPGLKKGRMTRGTGLKESRNARAHAKGGDNPYFCTLAINLA